jgi:hypothetical protein
MHCFCRSFHIASIIIDVNSPVFFVLLLIVTCFSLVLAINSLQLQWIHVLLQWIHVWLQ